MIPPRPPLPARTEGAKKVHARACGLATILLPHPALIPLTQENLHSQSEPHSNR